MSAGGCGATEEGQHAGVAVQPVVRNLAVAEEAGERKIAEALADDRELRRAAPEHVLAAAQAGVVEPALRRAVELALRSLSSMRVEILARGRRRRAGRT